MKGIETMSQRRTFTLLFLLALLVAAWPAQAQPKPLSATITISGTVSGPSGPVPNVWIGIGSPQDWQEATTNAGGFYSLSIQTEGQVRFHVRPPLTVRLSQANHRRGDATADITQDFVLPAGFLLDVAITAGGVPLAEPLGLEVQPLVEQVAGEWWYSLDWDDATQRQRAVLPPDVYYLTAHNPPAGTYDTTRPFDLRTGDLTADLALNSSYVHPIPYDPPVASLITIGPPDDLGEATVSGSPGAALPLARVLLVNLNSTHQAHTISEADGSFGARIYAPPGSAVMIKHGPASHRWGDLERGVSEMINPFPGTIINQPHTHTGVEGAVPFATAGGLELQVDDPGETRNHVGAAWAMTGTVGPLVVDGTWTRVLDGSYDGQAVPGLYLGGLNWTHPAPADLDADGDADLLVGAEPGRLVLYRNEGTATAPHWQYETDQFAGISVPGWAYPALVDVTADGAPDLFVGTGDGRVLIYHNQGTPQLPAWPASPDTTLAVAENAAPALDDLDNDGDLDLVIGHVGGTLDFYRNTGTTSAPAWTHQTGGYGGISEAGEGLQPAFVNLDGDGDLDLLIGLCGQVVWYERGGPVNNPTWTRHAADPIGFGGGSCGVSPGAGDWSGDGDPDLVTGEHWGGLRFFENQGTWAEQGFEFPFELAGDSAPALADWDDDGDLDLLVGQVHGQVLQYTNVGTATAPDWRPDGELLALPWTDHPHAFPTLADVDGDGDPDLFVGEGGWAGPGAGGNIHFYQNDGTASAPDWHLVTDHWLGLDVGGWSTPVFANLDGDGDLDLFIGDEAGTLTYVENTGTPTAPAWAAPVQPYAGLHLGEYTAPAFLDVDEDGDLDLLVGQGDGSLAYVRNTGSSSTPAWELVTTRYPGIHTGSHATPAATGTTPFIDNDGDADLLLGDGDGGLNLYRYDGPGTPPEPGQPYAPGDFLQVEGRLRLYGPAITAATNLEAIQVHGWPSLLLLFDADGRAVPAESYFMSTLLAPTGFPIQGGLAPRATVEGYVAPENLHHAGGHAIESDIALTLQLPEDLPPGIYRPTIWLDITGVPTSTQWLAANVTYHTFGPTEAALPPIAVTPGSRHHDSGDRQASIENPRLVWQLLMDDFVQGTRGAGAHEDQGTVALASQIVSQGAPAYVPPADARSGQPTTYRLEPFLPMISYTDRRMPTPPLLPFALPGGELHVTVSQPDGTSLNLGSEPFAQSFNRTKTTRLGHDLNVGTVQLDDVYSLQAASSRFRLTFDQYGHHVVTMAGTVDDIWGNHYQGGGTYDLWVAEPLDIDPGVLPGTPLAVGDAFNPGLQLHPGVPAAITLTLTLYPDSDPAQVQTHTLTGTANRFGNLARWGTDSLVTLDHPGEYRVDLTARYTTRDGTLYMGALTWGGIVMTPDAEADLLAHGRRGLDSLQYIPNHWFVASRDLTIPEGAISHTWNPYYNGDVLWTRMSDGPYGGDSLLIGASVQDPVGVVEAAIEARFERMHPPLAGPGTFEERVTVGELPLFVSTRSGRPPLLDPEGIDQLAYSYRSSQRPGVRVREVVSEDGQNGGYWRLDTLYDDQLGVGLLGDQANDFKFQYVGTVYRDLDTGRNEYLGAGNAWIFIPEDDPTGSRAMPPFAGYGAWTAEGGPLLTLQGEDVHIFILPTGVHPGAVLEVGDTFRFAGHVMPTLDSMVAVTVTAPSGAQYLVDGQANPVGYFSDPDDDLVVTEPGLWAVDVRVWHEGRIGTGELVLCATDPVHYECPSGDVLGSEGGRYWFYVVPRASGRLDVSSPPPGFLAFDGQVTPITISGVLPGGLTDAAVDYTISMPGYILAHGQATLEGTTYEVVFDPVALHEAFPNLDLEGRDEPGRPGLSDTFSIGLLLHGQSAQGAVFQANTVTIQGEQVFVGDAPAGIINALFLPLVSRGD